MCIRDSPEAIDDDGRELLTHSEQVRLEEEELKLRGLDTLRLLAAKSVFGNDSSRIASALLETKSDAVTTIPGWLDASIDILHNQVLCTAEIEHGWGLWDARSVSYTHLDVYKRQVRPSGAVLGWPFTMIPLLARAWSSMQPGCASY